jgi:restriction system protein
MARRGFFAELAHQQQVAARQRDQRERAATRAQATAQRQAEAAQKRAQAAEQRVLKAAAAEAKAAEKEVERLRHEAAVAAVEASNAELAATYEEIDGLLAATLAVDDWVDLNELRSVAKHPPFPHPELEQPAPLPPPIPPPPEPQFVAPPAPTGLFGKKKHGEAVAQAQSEFAASHQAWQAQMAALPAQQAQQAESYRRAEVARTTQLEEARERHQAECDRLDAEAAEANKDLEALIAGVAYGTEDAVQEYVGIVLSNSVYPDAFPVLHEHTFNSQLRELELTVLVPPPGEVPAIKEYKYVKSKGEITATPLPKAQQKERYVSAVHQVALRSLHEVFEADRAGWVQSISLTVAVDSVDPATGRNKRTPLIAVASARNDFNEIDLSNVVPLATLGHIGAVVSKNPFELVAIDDGQGVRRR